MDYELFLRARCTLEERKTLINHIAKVYSVVRINRQYGFLNFYDDYKLIEDQFLKTGQYFVLSGFDPGYIKKRLTNIINLQKNSGPELLKKLIIIEATDLIFCFDEDRKIKIRLFSLLGEEILADVLKNQHKYDDILDKLDPFKDKYPNLGTNYIMH